MKTFRTPLTLMLCLLIAALGGCAKRAPAPPNEPPDPITVSPSPAMPSADAFDALDADEFAILFVNVGRADAAILRFGEQTILIDTGSKSSAPQLIGGLNLLDSARIDAAFITHSHADHLGGLAAINANYEIGNVYYPLLTEKNNDGVSKIAARCQKLSLPCTALTAGERIAVSQDVSFDILGPLVYNADDDNDNSLIIRFAYGGKTFLFVGDMQFAEEDSLLSAGLDLSADALKVGNHGNPDATGEAFAHAVSPTFALISTDTREDDNSANPRVFAALGAADIRVTQDFPVGVLLTLRDGALAVTSPEQANRAAPSVVISALSLKQQTVTLKNTGDAVCDLSGCIVYCDRSDATKRIPDGTTLPAGETLTISADGGGGALVFRGEDKPLNLKKTNVVSLYSAYGALLSSMQD